MEPVAGAIPVIIPVNPWTLAILKIDCVVAAGTSMIVFGGFVEVYPNPAFVSDTEVIVPAAETVAVAVAVVPTPTPTDLGAANAIGKVDPVYPKPGLVIERVSIEPDVLTVAVNAAATGSSAVTINASHLNVVCL